jgi:putative endonuclease
MLYREHPQIYYVYILLCSDKSYYTGLTDDLDQQYFHHQIGKFLTCYTFKRRPVQLVYYETHILLEDAILRDEQIKKWSRAKKKALIEANFDRLKRLSECDNFSHYKYQAIRRADVQNNEDLDCARSSP